MLWGTLDTLFRDAHLNFGYDPVEAGWTVRIECTLADGQWVAAYFGFYTTIGDVVEEMSALVNAASEVPHAAS